MAIDNAEKRRSISGIQHFLIPGVTPNATPDMEWRQQVGFGYSGTGTDEPAPPPVAEGGHWGADYSEVKDRSRPKKRRSRKQLRNLIKKQVRKTDDEIRLELNAEIENQIIESVREDKILQDYRALQIDINSNEYLGRELEIINRELLEYNYLIQTQLEERRAQREKDEEEAIIMLLLQD